MGGFAAAGDRLIGIGDVEIALEGRQAKAVGVAIDGAADVVVGERSAATAEAGIEAAGDAEEAVAEGFEFETARRLVGEPAVGGVAFAGGGRRGAALLPRGGGHDVTVEGFQRPVVRDEPRGEVVK